MTSLGRISEIWSYPVSAISGERLGSVQISPTGVAGDRAYALIDASSGAAAAPEREARWRKALFLQATQKENAPPSIVFPDGHVASVEHPALNARLSDYFGFPVAIGVYASDAGFPLTQHRHTHFPLHLLTTASLSHLAVLRQSPMDVRRFRPTILVETNGKAGFVEDGWVGYRIRLGEATLEVNEQAKRCGVTFLAQPGLAEDPDILRSIVRYNKRHLGVYCSVLRAGTVRQGDELMMEG